MIVCAAREWIYALDLLRSRAWFSLTKLLCSESSSLDAAFILSPLNAGWILERVCIELQRHHPGDSLIHRSDRTIPLARTYFFSHYALLISSLRHNPHLWGKPLSVFFTHKREINVSEKFLLRYLKRAHRVFTMNTEARLGLIERGLAQDSVRVVIGAADPERFVGHARGSGRIGFCCAYYPRKAPHRIVSLVRALPRREFMLIGRGWKGSAELSELERCDNFSYIEASYEEYPALYSTMDVFVSISTLEGGPIPLLEAMMCNCVPVASRTGFAPDIIREDENGFLFDVQASIDEVSEKVERALRASFEVRSSVTQYSWHQFSKDILEGLGQPSR